MNREMLSLLVFRRLSQQHHLNPPLYSAQLKDKSHNTNSAGVVWRLFSRAGVTKLQLMWEVLLQRKSLVTLAHCSAGLGGSALLCLLTDESERVGHVVRRVMPARSGQASYYTLTHNITGDLTTTDWALHNYIRMIRMKLYYFL